MRIAEGFARKTAHSPTPAVDSSVRYVRSFAEAVEAVSGIAQPRRHDPDPGGGSVAQVGSQILKNSNPISHLRRKATHSASQPA